MSVDSKVSLDKITPGQSLSPNMCMGFQLLSHVHLTTPWTVAQQAPLSIGFFRQQYGVVCHFLLQGIFPIRGSSPPLLCLQTQKTLFIINNIANGSYLKWKGLFTWDNLCRVCQLTFKLRWWVVNRIAHYRRFGVGIEKYLKNWVITKNSSNKVF